MSDAAYVAADLGAESGRVLLGRFDGERVELDELHRFPNAAVRTLGRLKWDALMIFAEITEGLGRAAKAGPVESVGVDSWGVDFGLLDGDGCLLGNPYSYRDERRAPMMARAEERMPREELYAATGIQFIPINSLYGLLAHEGSRMLDAAERLVFVPDLMSYWLSGERMCEETIASTSQLWDPSATTWAWPVIERMGLPSRLFGPLMPPGTELGPLLAEVAEEAGLPGRAPVIAVASHDTASAVAAVPAEGDDFAYVSSGTWSLVGLELPGPVITPQALESNLTNEWGVGRRVRLLRNVMGLWLLQQCRRTWAREGFERSWEELVALAEAAPPDGPLVDPDLPAFLAPGDMPGRICRACEATGQRAPSEPGEVVRCVLESLACKYRMVLESAEAASGRRADTIHVVGGGSRNPLLCQLTADFTGRPVVAGPVEATALGNVLVQAWARGRVGSLEEIREVVRASTRVRRYEPADARDDTWSRFERVLAGAA
jgi:rhamnulokinase